MLLELDVKCRAEHVTADMEYFFSTYGSDAADGQLKTHASHMLRCAMLARDNLSDAPVIIAALLHDIASLLKYEQTTEAFGLFGIDDFEDIGAAYLHRNGFSQRVCTIVEQYRTAQRYLATIDAVFKMTLAPDVLSTIQWQGGTMTPAEVLAFEEEPYFNDIINVGRWAANVHQSAATPLSINYYRKMILEHLR